RGGSEVGRERLARRTRRRRGAHPPRLTRRDPRGKRHGTPRAMRAARDAEDRHSRRRVVRNRHEARRPACRIGALGPRAVGPEGSGVAASVLKNLDIDLKKIRQEVEKLVSTGTTMVTMGQLPFTPRAKKVLELSLEEASNLGHTYIGTEHLLLGLIRESEGIAAQVLRNLK